MPAGHPGRRERPVPAIASVDDPEEHGIDLAPMPACPSLEAGVFAADGAPLEQKLKIGRAGSIVNVTLLHGLEERQLQETIFFSWQSDRPVDGGKQLIEGAIVKALTELSTTSIMEAATRHEIVLDQDSKGEPGSPPITDMIFSKIDNAGVFVPDLTFVGTRADGRPTPNPNVLIEYGWALKARGYRYMVPVMNVAYGEPSDSALPFDLRHLRHPITYSCPESASDEERRIACDELAKNLVREIGAVLTSANFVSRRNPRFIARVASDEGGRFRSFDEPIGLVDSTAEPSKKVELDHNAPLVWLRVMPLKAVERKLSPRLLKKAIRPSEEVNRLRTFRGSFKALSLVANDGYGTCNDAFYRSTDDCVVANSVAFFFSTGEIWSVDTHEASSPGESSRLMPLHEKTLVQLLDEYGALLRSLEIGPPYRWVFGMEDVRGRGIPVRWQLGPFGSCKEDRIEMDGTWAGDNSAGDALEGLFAAIYSACGLARAEVMHENMKFLQDQKSRGDVAPREAAVPPAENASPGIVASPRWNRTFRALRTFLGRNSAP